MYSNTQFLNKIIYENIDGFTFKMNDNGHFEAQHPVHGYFETHWGAFNNPHGIRGFIIGLDDSYITGRMGGRMERVSDPKGTIRNIRKFIRDNYRWYENMEDHKEAREEIKGLKSNIEIFGAEYICEKNYSSKILKEIMSQEPWHFIETKLNDRVKACLKAFKKLQIKVKQELNK